MLFSLALVFCFHISEYKPRPVNLVACQPWIAQLDSNSWAVRDRAFRGLLGKGKPILPLVTKYVDDPRFEVRESCREIIELIYLCRYCHGFGDCEPCRGKTWLQRYQDLCKECCPDGFKMEAVCWYCHGSGKVGK